MIGFIIFLSILLSLFSKSAYADISYPIEFLEPDMIKVVSINKKMRIGLITNQTGVLEDGTRSVEILKKNGFFIAVIFAPEHGYWGMVPAGDEVLSTIDPDTNIPVVSLYAKGGGKAITQQQMDLVDLLFFDIQDSGMRHFTYISLLYKIMEAARLFKKPLVICDRPNPLGRIMEGPLVDPSLISFISIAPVPLRHGMTIGELALYFNRYFMNSEVLLQVVPLKKYGRMPLVSLPAPLSPNIRTIASVRGYAFLGLMGEIRPLDVGLGGPSPFQILALPESIPQAKPFFVSLLPIFKRHGLDGRLVSYVHAQKKNQRYYGLRFHLSEGITFSTMKIWAAFFAHARAYDLPLTFSLNFNKAFGIAQLKDSWEQKRAFDYSLFFTSVAAFYEKARCCFLYKPFPSIHGL